MNELKIIIHSFSLILNERSIHLYCPSVVRGHCTHIAKLLLCDIGLLVANNGSRSTVLYLCNIFS